MEILVTGAPGWLGSRLVEALTRGIEGEPPAFAGCQVRCLIAPGIDATPVERLGAVGVRGDLTDPTTLDQPVRGVELVFHLAGLIHPRKRINELFAINAEGTRHLLDAAAAAGVKRFVYVSSNSVGGVNISRDRLMTEEDPPRPYLAYGRSKLAAEQAIRTTAERGLMQTVIVRPCWFYGPGQPARQTRFFRMITSGSPIIFGDGRNLRSLSYVDNTVHGLILAAQRPQANGQTYWLADERPYPTIEIYETVARILDVKPFRPRFLPDVTSATCRLADRLIQAAGLYQTELHVAGEMNQDIACSVEKAKRELGYQPKVSLEDGMRRSIAWCRQQGMDV